MYEPENSPWDEPLTEEIERLASTADVDPLPVHVLTGAFGRKHVTAIIKDSGVFITQAARERLPLYGLRFMLAHEVAHLMHLKKLREHRGRNKPLVAALLITTVLLTSAGIVILRVMPIGDGSLMRLVMMAIGAAVVITYGVKHAVTSPAIELWCDEKAAELIGNPRVALETLEVMLADQTPREARWGGYPTAETRINQIRHIISRANDLG